MKIGRNVQDFAVEIQRQAQAKKDYLASTTALDMIVEESAKGASLDHIVRETAARREQTIRQAANFGLQINGVGTFPVRELTHQQIAEYCKIPMPYYTRMREQAPGLLRENVQTWFQLGGDKRMVRLLDGQARAFLSDRYRPLDNFDLFQAALQPLIDSGATIVSSELTETRMYIKAISHRIRIEVKVGDVIEAGILIQNSEVGLGALSVAPFLNRLVCMNGMVANELGARRTHVGRSSGNGSDIPEEWMRDETRAADDKAFFMKVQDVVRGSFDESKFEGIARKLTDSTKRTIDADPVKLVTAASAKFNLNTEETSAVLRHLVSGGDLTQWGLANAVTRHASDVESYDRATELERAGGQVVELPDSDWQALLKEAA